MRLVSLLHRYTSTPGHKTKQNSFWRGTYIILIFLSFFFFCPTSLWRGSGKKSTYINLNLVQSQRQLIRITKEQKKYILTAPEENFFRFFGNSMVLRPMQKQGQEPGPAPGTYAFCLLEERTLLDTRRRSPHHPSSTEGGAEVRKDVPE